MTWLRDLFDYTLSIPLWWFCIWSLSLYVIGMFMGFIGDKDAHPKFGFRREGANGYITEDGVTWTKVSTILPYESTKGLYLFGKYDGSQKAPIGSALNVKLWNSATKDISSLF